MTYPFPNVNGSTIEVRECISNFTQYFIWTHLFIHAARPMARFIVVQKWWLPALVSLRTKLGIHSHSLTIN